MNENISTVPTRKRFNWLEILVAAIVALILSGLLAYGAGAETTQRTVVLHLDAHTDEVVMLDDLAVGESRTVTTEDGRPVTITRESEGLRLVIGDEEGASEREILVDTGLTPGHRTVVLRVGEDGEVSERRVITLGVPGHGWKGIFEGEEFDSEKLRRHMERVREKLRDLDLDATLRERFSREEWRDVVEKAIEQAGKAREAYGDALKDLRIELRGLAGGEDAEVWRLPAPGWTGEAGGRVFRCPHDDVRVRVPKDAKVPGALSCPVCGQPMEERQALRRERRIIRQTPPAPEAPAPPSAP